MDETPEDASDSPRPSTSGVRLFKESDSSSESPSEEELPKNLELLLDDADDYEGIIEKEITCVPKRRRSTPPPSQPATKKRRARRQHSKIPPHLKGLMGEANLRFARGDVETAEKMCYEVIRQIPNAHEPYLTLAQIYEPDQQKSLLYHVIAAHLCPQNVDQWCRLAQISLDANNLKQAVTYYTQAIKADMKNVELHMKRIQLLETIGDKRTALRCKVRLTHILDAAQQHATIVQIAREVAQKFYEEKEYGRAIDALNVPFERCPDKISLDVVNMMLQLLLQNGDYSQCLDIFVQHCNIEIEVILLEEKKLKVLSYGMPPDIQIDLRIKFIVCLIQLECFELVQQLISALISEDTVETVGDLYLDVAEALMAANHHQDALQLLVPLVKSKNFSLAAVWLKHAECLSACNMIQQAIESYYVVMKLAPMHVEVRYPLAMLLLNENKQEEALSVLSQDSRTQDLDVLVLIKKLEVLKILGHYEEYWKSAELLLSRHCTVIRHPEEIRAVTFLERPGEKLSRVKKLRNFRGEELDETPTFIAAGETNPEEEYKTLVEILETCKEHKRYALMQKFAFTALTSTKLKNVMDDLSLLAFFTSIYNQDAYHGYSLIREIVIHNRDNHKAWNLFNLLLQGADDIRHNRFMIRLLRKHTGETNLKMLEANYALAVGNYKTAMKYYSMFFNQRQSPLILFLIGVTMLQIICQKVDGNKTQMIRTVMDLFFEYGNTRGEGSEQEVKYNLGRLFQLLDLPHLAATCYEEALRYEHPLIAGNRELLDLRREIAYNLHLIYAKSGRRDLARRVLCENIIV